MVAGLVLALVAGLVLPLGPARGPFGAAHARPETRLKPAWVSGSVARLRRSPDGEAAITARLRIGTEVRVLERKGSWAEVSTAIGERGFVKVSLLSGDPPRLAALLARADEAGSAARARTWLERATAFAPGDLDVIGRLVANYRALGRAEAAWSVEKGLIAAERRQLSWDGPLYPLRGEVVWLPAPCADGVVAKSREPALAAGPRPPVSVLRARAFPLVNSGKVVAITARGNKTQVLDAPVCISGPCGAPQAGYALQDPGGDGLLVPSWLVAGFRVEGYRPRAGGGARYEDEAGRSRIDVDDSSYSLSLRTFDGWRTVGTWPLVRPGARPVAQASEHERGLLLFWQGASARSCCPDEVEVWAERVDALDEERPRHAAGRVYSQGRAPACPQETFTDLEGEPRCARLPGGCHLDDDP